MKVKPRGLSLFDVTCLGANAIIGAGIFALPDDLSRELGGASPIAFVVCALGLYPVARAYALLSARTTATGGPAVYAREAFGGRAGFVVGWMCFVNSILSFSAVAQIAGAYLGRVTPQLASPLGLRLSSTALIVAFSVVNYFGARLGARVAAIFTIGKVASLLLLIGWALPHVELARLTLQHGRGLQGIAPAIFLAVFALQGFEVAPVPAEDTRDPERVMPRAILGSLAIATLLYIALQTVFIGAAADSAHPSDTPLVDLAGALSPTLLTCVVLGGILSTFGFVAGNALGTPRYAYALARDGFLPRTFATLHARFATPHRAILATAITAALCVNLFEARALMGMSNVSVAVQYLGSSLAVYKLRGARATGILGALVSLWIFAQGDARELSVAAGALAIGAVIAFASRRRSSRG